MEDFYIATKGLRPGAGFAITAIRDYLAATRVSRPQKTASYDGAVFDFWV